MYLQQCALRKNARFHRLDLDAQSTTRELVDVTNLESLLYTLGAIASTALAGRLRHRIH